MSTTVIGRVPELGDADEPFRAALVAIWERLGADEYPDGAALLADLDDLDALLRAHRGERVADGRLADLRARARTFGLHVAKLDLRVHASAIRAPDERLRGTLAAAAAAQARHGAAAIDRLIVSMTRTADDVLTAEGLAREAGAALQGVPLLETIADLRAAGTLVEEILDRSPRPTPRGDGGLLGLGQGRRLPDGAVGDLPRAGGAGADRRGPRRRADRSSTAVAARRGGAAARRTPASSPSRVAPSTVGSS